MKVTFAPLLPLFLFLSAVSVGCSGDKDKEKSEASNLESVTINKDLGRVAEVDTITLKPSTFTCDLVSNGRIKASETVDLTLRSQETVREVLVHNGQRVNQGQTLLKMDTSRLLAEKESKAGAVGQAELQMQDVLIGQGYDPADTTAIPLDVMRLAKVKSGLDQAQAAYRSTMMDIADATVKAPVSGVVANLAAQRFSRLPGDKPALRIINDASMAVEFPILESELPLVGVGDGVSVSPFSGGAATKGSITEINPMIDENGHVTVKAAIGRTSGMIDGMNVRLRISRSLGNRLIVPKRAVVLRGGRQVVFTLRPTDNKAMWNYVTTGLENLDSYEITEGLKAGDIVITSSNENLAHEAPVAPHP